MKLTVVGCAGSFPNASSPASCYLLEHDGASLALDLGNGSLGALAQYLPAPSLDAVAISHFHPDHCADLGSLYVVRRYDPAGAHPQIPVLGPPGIAARIAAMYGSVEQENLDLVFDFAEYGPDLIQVGPFAIATFRVDHCIPAYAIRVTAGGRTLVYSGDTAPCDGLVEAARGADLALFEASYVESGDNPPHIHMTGAEAGDMANQAGVDRLILTHLVAWNSRDEVRKDAESTFGGDLSLAKPGLTATV